MAIKISWPNFNAAVADGVYIYRDIAKIPADNLPTPIATLAGSAVSYVDTTAELNKVYHYRVGVYKGTDLLISNDFIAANFPSTGPGPQMLLKGDWRLGYFGVVSPSDFLNFSEIYSQLGLTVGTLQSDASNLGWHKFVRDGTILFIAINQMLQAISWNQLYANGLIYGTNDNGTPPAGSFSANNPRNQRRTVTKNGKTFIVRSLKGSTKSTSLVLSTLNDGYENSEFAETVSRLYFSASQASNANKWSDISTAVTTLAQHAVSTTNAHQMTNENGGSIAMAVNSVWFPVLEFVP